MNKAKFLKGAIAYMLVLLFTFPGVAMSQGGGTAVSQDNTGQVFRPEELDQLLAPIALYPDALLAQVFTAATYPVDIVAADRFVKEHPGLKDAALVDAAKDKDWATSVKAMLQFPDVLAMMDNQLEWTTKLGDAFLAQQRDVMDSVQRLRQKAYSQGKLTNSKEQLVTVEPQTQTIIIEQASPEIVYVPVYDPMVVYGPWWYPDYPPYICYYPGFIGGLYLGGFFVNFDWGWRSWDCDWHHHNVNIYVNNFNRFVTHSFARPSRFHIDSAGRTNVAWQHNAQYRRGAGYRDYWTAQRFGGRQVSQPAVKQSAPAYRGFEQNRVSPSSTPSAIRNPGIAARSDTRVESRRANIEPNRVNVVHQPAVRPIASTSTAQVSRVREDATVFSGVGRGGSERAASYRGQSSSQAVRSSGGSSASRSSSEMSRSGGESGHGGGGHEGNRR